MSPSADNAFKRIASNRRALRDYMVLERLEAGIELRGTEVKSIRNGQLSLSGSFARVEGGEALLFNLNILPYDHGNRFNHEPDRTRRLLLHRREIARLAGMVQRQGYTLVPLKLYFNDRGIAKLLLGIAVGKRKFDKRETEKRRDWERQKGRLMREKG